MHLWPEATYSGCFVARIVRSVTTVVMQTGTPLCGLQGAPSGLSSLRQC